MFVRQPAQSTPPPALFQMPFLWQSQRLSPLSTPGSLLRSPLLHRLCIERASNLTQVPATEHALRGGGGGGGGGGGETAGHRVILVLEFNKTNKLKEKNRGNRREEKRREETRTRENKIKTNACASAVHKRSCKQWNHATSTSSVLYAVRFMLCAVVLLIVPVQLLARLQPRL